MIEAPQCAVVPAEGSGLRRRTRTAGRQPRREQAQSATGGRLSSGIRAVRERYQRCSRRWRRIRWPRLWHQSAGVGDRHRHPKKDKTGFTCEKYFAAELENVAFARKAFVKSHVVQYVNFWPCEWNNDKKFMSRAFEFAQANSIGLGGPDIVPYKKGQMKNCLPILPSVQGQVEPGGDGGAGTDADVHQPRNEKAVHARRVRGVRGDYLGVDIIFWATASPWLRPET